MRVNQTPVLRLWAAVVAQVRGFDHDEALTLGRALAGPEIPLGKKGWGASGKLDPDLIHKMASALP